MSFNEKVKGIWPMKGRFVCNIVGGIVFVFIICVLFGQCSNATVGKIQTVKTSIDDWVDKNNVDGYFPTGFYQGMPRNEAAEYEWFYAINDLDWLSEDRAYYLLANMKKTFYSDVFFLQFERKLYIYKDTSVAKSYGGMQLGVETIGYLPLVEGEYMGFGRDWYVMWTNNNTIKIFDFEENKQLWSKKFNDLTAISIDQDYVTIQQNYQYTTFDKRGKKLREWIN